MGHPFDADPILVEVVRNGYVERAPRPGRGHRGRRPAARLGGHGVRAHVSAELAGSRCRRWACCGPGSTSPAGTWRWSRLPLGRAEASRRGARDPRPRRARRVVLQTPADWPLDEAARETWIRSGQAKSSIAMNCSGKHAGMIRAAQRRGDDLANYLDPDHGSWPSCRRSTDRARAGPEPGRRRLQGPDLRPVALRPGAGLRPAGRGDRRSRRLTVATSIREHPGASRGLRGERADPGGARADRQGRCRATSPVGLPDGRGVAVKISDGSARARAVAMAGVLQQAGVRPRNADRAGQRPGARPRRAGRRDPALCGDAQPNLGEHSPEPAKLCTWVQE